MLKFKVFFTLSVFFDVIRLGIPFSTITNVGAEAECTDAQVQNLVAHGIACTVVKL